MRESRRERLGFILVWLCMSCLPIFLRPLWEPDEARYAEIPREMLALGDWLTPHLNYVDYFEKPPLQYWLSAASMKLFGLHPWAARLPLALAGLIALGCAWVLARRAGVGRPLRAVFMVATALLGFVCGQILTLDALFTSLLLLSITAFIEAVAARSSGKGELGWTLLAFGACALATLTKGLAAPVLAGAILFCATAFVWRQRELRRAILRTFRHPLGWILFPALASPWFIAVEHANPGHARFFFLHEHFARFSTDVAHRLGSKNPVLDKLYFFAILLPGLVPWLCTGLRGVGRTWSFLRRDGAADPLQRWVIAMLAMSAAVPFVFFTLSHSKLPPYILPALIPLVVLSCTFIGEAEWRVRLRSTGWELLVLGALIFCVAPFAFKGVRTWPWALPLGALFMGLGLWARADRFRESRWACGLLVALLLMVLGGQAAGGPGKAWADLVDRAPAHAQWISCGRYYQVLPFETRKRVALVAGTGELAFGRDRLAPAERDRWFQEEARALLPLARRMQREAPAQPVWALVREGTWKGLPPEEQAAWEMVAKRAGTLLLRLLP